MVKFFGELFSWALYLEYLFHIFNRLLFLCFIHGKVTQLGQGPRIITSETHQDWTIPAIISCLCCFWPTGIFAIWYASKVNVVYYFHRNMLNGTFTREQDIKICIASQKDYCLFLKTETRYEFKTCNSYYWKINL